MTVIDSLKRVGTELLNLFAVPVFLVVAPILIVMRGLEFIVVDLPAYIKSKSKREPVQKN
jgi:hypothetical protein